jgi:uncharacterized protein (DUF2345 family)
MPIVFIKPSDENMANQDPRTTVQAWSPPSGYVSSWEMQASTVARFSRPLLLWACPAGAVTAAAAAAATAAAGSSWTATELTW